MICVKMFDASFCLKALKVVRQDFPLVTDSACEIGLSHLECMDISHLSSGKGSSKKVSKDTSLKNWPFFFNQISPFPPNLLLVMCYVLNPCMESTFSVNPLRPNANCRFCRFWVWQNFVKILIHPGFPETLIYCLPPECSL